MYLLKKLFPNKESKNIEPNKEWELNIPFTKGDKWIEIYLENNKYLTITFKEMYETEDKLTDVRPFFNLEFRIPFRKEVI